MSDDGYRLIAACLRFFCGSPFCDAVECQYLKGRNARTRQRLEATIQSLSRLPRLVISRTMLACPSREKSKAAMTIRMTEVLISQIRAAHGNGSDDDQGGQQNGGQSQVVLDTKPRTKKPSMYKVIMLNDDYTPMEFVVYVLQQFFGMSNSQATAIMLNVHQRGVGVCGIYSYEIAEAKATKVMDYARQNEHPLQLQIEKE